MYATGVVLCVKKRVCECVYLFVKWCLFVCLLLHVDLPFMAGASSVVEARVCRCVDQFGSECTGSFVTAFFTPFSVCSRTFTCVIA